MRGKRRLIDSGRGEENMNVAFIPVRGGSKSIPLKNIKQIGGKPLVYWTVKAACKCKYIDRVYIATDSDMIKETVEKFKAGQEAELFFKAELIGRSVESALDTAPTEFAMLEFAHNYEFDNIVLIQATSPLLQTEDIEHGFEIFNGENVDSVLSVVRQRRFYWRNDENGFSHAVNYDVFHRPRRQEFDGCLVENGAFYISSKSALLKSKNRVSGNIKTVEMNEDTYYEIDEPDDWIIVEELMKKRGITALEEIPEIKLFLTDCDGCLTDCGMYYSEKGDELKKFNARDGMGFAMLRKKGILTGIITSEEVELNRRRAKKLKLDIYESDCRDKADIIRKICTDRQIDLENVVYIGDDINDVEAIKIVGYGCCPLNAVPEVKAVARYVANTRGGGGVIREVVDKILRNYSVEE